MYYRLEYPDGKGIFSKELGYIDDDYLKPLRRGLHVPKIFKEGKISGTKSWYTEYGYQKYKKAIELVLKEANSYPYNRGLKLITTETVEEIISKGKVQIVALNN